MILLNSAQTNVGRVRTENQDCFGVKQEKDFFFVCDGMGGGVAGDFASKAAVDVILSLYDNINKQDCLDILGSEFENYEEEIIKPIALIKMANRYLYTLTKKYPKLSGMGTTCSAVWFDKKKSLIHIYNVGDSRVYRIRNGKIQQLTEDHSKIKELIDSGKMTQEDAKTAEIQSMITRALGIVQTVKVDYKSEIVKNGDVYVLCTDGLNGELSDFTINDIVNIHKPDVESISSELITVANNSGGRDNTTVISVFVQEDMDNDIVDIGVPNPDIIISKDEEKEETSKEDLFIRRFTKNFSVPIPQLATKKNLLKSPLFIALIIALIFVCIVSVFTFVANDKGKQRNITELTGNVSGIRLDIRTLPDEKIEEFINTTEKVYKLQLLQDWFLNFESELVPMQNVTISLDLAGQNKYMGLSGYKPLEIKLPKGTYTMTLSYPGYKILNDKMVLKDSLDIYLENADNLTNLSVIMVPEKDFTDR